MAEVFTRTRTKKVLGQAAPVAATATTLYTVPVKYQVKGFVTVCERGGVAATYRIALRPDGDTLANEHYVVYDRALPANTDDETVEFWLDETDVITVYASSANLSFTFIGLEEPEE